MAQENNLLDPYVLAKIEGLPLRAKVVSEGVLAGMHSSKRHGVNVEFADHKEYAPGDDTRYLDWRAYARRDKFSIKKFEEERGIKCYLAMDVSRSMQYFGSLRKLVGKVLEKGKPSGFSKLDYAKILAASLAYMLIQQRDGVGIFVLKEGQDRFIPAKADPKHLNQLYFEMEQLRADVSGKIGQGIDYVGHHLTQPSMVILFSDLLGDWQETLLKLQALRALRHDVVVFHLLDRFEIDFPFPEAMEFEELDGRAVVVANAPSIRKTYRQEIQSYLETVRRSCLGSNITYVFATTDQPLNEPLQTFLVGRQGLLGQ